MAVVVPLWAAMCAGGTAAAAAVLALSPRRSPARPEAPVLAEEEAPPPPDAPESDNESDGSADERDGVADEGDDRGRKGMKRFSIDERWLQRCDRKVIGADLAEGCGCPKQCTDQLTVAMVEEERKSEGKKGGVLRRSELRLYLESNRTAATKLGFKLHPEHDDSILLCPGAFDILKGYGYGYTYKFAREVKAGDGQDAQHGGYGGSNDGFGEDSLQKMAFIGWWKDLREETEFMPNTNFRELDFIEEKDLYAECKSDLLESGAHESNIGSIKLWKQVWKAHCGDVKIRKHRRVDGKDRKRAFLRYLLRRKVTRNKADRDLLRHLRGIYRDTCRRERTYYWEANIQPSKYPRKYTCYISDGATQADYCLPKMPGFSLGRNVLPLKLVGNIFHGHCLVFHIVLPHVKDDANLNMHCLDTSLEVLETVREGKGLPPYCTPQFRGQWDGVSTNWGSVSFAHIERLHNERILGSTTDVRRNKVGSTHEDVDGLFAIIKAYVKNKEIMTPQELKAAILEAFRTYKLPVFVLFVDATFDYKAHYEGEGHIDKKLGGYGYSHMTDGYHCLTFDESKSISPTGVAFKKYQQDFYVDVALQRKDLPVDKRPVEDAEFEMCPMIVENHWEPATILLTSPTGKPAVAAPVDGFESMYAQVLVDLEQVNSAHGSKLTAPMLLQWREFCDERPKTLGDLKVHASLPKWNWATRPPTDAAELANNGRTPAQLAAQTIMARAVNVTQPRTISSSVSSGAEGRADRDSRTADARMRGDRTALKQNEWILYKAKYDCCPMANKTGATSCGGCHMPFLLGQIHGEIDELDTTDPDTRVEIKCWTPKERCYEGDWSKWIEGGTRRQLVATIEVGHVVLQNVYFTTAKPKAGGLLQLATAIKTQVRQHAQSNWAGFGVRGADRAPSTPARAGPPATEPAVAAAVGGGSGSPAPHSPVPQVVR